MLSILLNTLDAISYQRKKGLGTFNNIGLSLFFQDQQDIIKFIVNKHDVSSFQRKETGCEL